MFFKGRNVKRPQWFQSLEDARERFEHSARTPISLSCRLFRVPIKDPLLKLPDDGKLADFPLTEPGLRSETRLEWDQESARLFWLRGQKDAFLPFFEAAEAVGECIVRLTEVLPSFFARCEDRKPETRWLWCVFQLAWHGELPGVKPKRDLWSGDPPAFLPYNRRALEWILSGTNAQETSKVGLDDGSWDLQLERHYSIELPNVFIASVEAVSFLTKAWEKALESRLSDQQGASDDPLRRAEGTLSDVVAAVEDFPAPFELTKPIDEQVAQYECWRDRLAQAVEQAVSALEHPGVMDSPTVSPSGLRSRVDDFLFKWRTGKYNHPMVPLDRGAIQEQSESIALEARNQRRAVREAKLRPSRDSDRAPAEISTNSKEQRSAPAAKALRPSRERAYRLFQYAISKRPELAAATDRQVHDWLTQDPETCDHIPRRFDTFSTYLREARAHYDDRKHNPRHRRMTGRSIVHSDEI